MSPAYAHRLGVTPLVPHWIGVQAARPPLESTYALTRLPDLLHALASALGRDAARCDCIRSNDGRDQK